MSTTASETDHRSDHSLRTTRNDNTAETKASLKTTEIIFYLATVAGVLIASAMVDENEDGQGFGADRAWLYVTILTVGYLISRGLAKSGSHQPYDEDNS